VKKTILALSVAGLLAACSSSPYPTSYRPNRTPYSDLLETARNNCNAGDHSACQDLGSLAQADAQVRADRRRAAADRQRRFDESIAQMNEGLAIMNASRPVPPRVVFDNTPLETGHPATCSVGMTVSGALYCQ
jgi:hypothetical protein